MAIARITPQEALKEHASGKALLVCAYDDDVKFSTMKLKGAISRSSLDRRLDRLPLNQEIIFYCA